MPLDWLIASMAEKPYKPIIMVKEIKDSERNAAEIEDEHVIANLRGWVPPVYIDLAIAFYRGTRITPRIKDQKLWIKGLKILYKKEVIPQDLRNGIK